MLDRTRREQRRLLSLPVDRVDQNLIELEIAIRSGRRSGRCCCGGLNIARLNLFEDVEKRWLDRLCFMRPKSRRASTCGERARAPTSDRELRRLLDCVRLGLRSRAQGKLFGAARCARTKTSNAAVAVCVCVGVGGRFERRAASFLPRRVQAKRADGACRSRPSRRSVTRDVLARTRSNSLADTVSFCTAARCTARGPSTCVTCVPVRTSKPTGGCPTLLDAAAAARADDGAHKLAVVPDRVAAALADTGRPKRSRPIIRWLITLDDWELSSFWRSELARLSGALVAWACFREAAICTKNNCTHHTNIHNAICAQEGFSQLAAIYEALW